MTTPETWSAYCMLAFGLGGRHGFDADHLTVIDGIVRRTLKSNPAIARLSGCLFALGHGIVVAGAAVVTLRLTSRWAMPDWFVLAGTILSVAVLITLGTLNLAAAFRRQVPTEIAPVGLKAQFLPARIRPDNAATILLTGMLFAISFDTLTQAAGLSIAGGAIGGMPASCAGIGCFIFGMLAASGLNGVWVAHLIAVADRRAAIAGRIMVFTVGLLNISVGLLAATQLLLPRMDRLDGGVKISAAVMAAVAIGFGSAMLCARRDLHFGKPHDKASGDLAHCRLSEQQRRADPQAAAGAASA